MNKQGWLYLARAASLALLVIVLNLTGRPVRADATGTPVSGTISTNTNWSVGGSPYIVNGDVTVSPGVILSIAPGVEVRFNGIYALIVRGTLIAEGDNNHVIVFTSNKPTPAKGDWGVLDFRSDSQNSRLSYVMIFYGGNKDKYGEWCAAGAVCVRTSSFLLEHSSVMHSATRGLVLVNSSAVIDNNSFDDSTYEGIRLGGCNPAVDACRPTISGNFFSYNASAIQHAAPFDPIMAGNSADLNGVNGYVFELPCSYAFPAKQTWYANDLTYVVPSGGNYCTISDAHITIQPGTLIKLAGGLEFSSNSVVTATGTFERPILFTSLKDDGPGGDTNNDGRANLPGRGDWSVVRLTSGAVGRFEYTELRYGGASSAFPGLILVDGGSRAEVQHSRLYESAGPGMVVGLGSRALIERNVLHDLTGDGIDLLSLEPVTVTANTISHAKWGAYIYRGSPWLSENTFEYNQIGVRSVCINCSPRVSPNNRFNGFEGQAISNGAGSVCVDARFNWWNNINGPKDSSTAADACGLADNPGGGEAVSDGVNYNPWQGGLARPILATPGCGVTAQDLPSFSGYSAVGSTITFYDGEDQLGQANSSAGNRFTWTPAQPLADGLHILTARASLSGQQSLPSRPLTLTVDSSLPFDPQGVRFYYDFHGKIYTQRLHDADGCAVVSGDLQTPIRMRPGTTMTVSVPVRTSGLNSGASATQMKMTPPIVAEKPASIRDLSKLPQGKMVVTITNNSDQVLIGYKPADVDGDPDYRIYGAYQKGIRFPHKVGPGESITITVDHEQDIALVNNHGQMAFRQEVAPDKPATNQISIPADTSLGAVQFNNQTGVDFTSLYFARKTNNGTGKDYFGGSVITATSPISGTGGRVIHVPQGDYDVIARDKNGGLYIRHITVGPDGQTEISFDQAADSSMHFWQDDQADNFAHGLQVFRYPDDQEDHRVAPTATPVNLLQLLQLPYIGGEFAPISATIRLEPGWYFFAAEDHEHFRLGTETRSISGDWNSWLIPDHSLGETIGILLLSIQGRETQAGCDNQLKLPMASFKDCHVVAAAASGRVEIRVCKKGPSTDCYTIGGGNTTIDPDGYVYNAALGLAARISGATVTCDQYDPDYHSWARWPAELWDSQVNPQVTGADGYYAFFVPPGFYRIQASAPGYALHTSPVIQVISDVVHYNVPLVTRVYLPLAYKK